MYCTVHATSVLPQDDRSLQGRAWPLLQVLLACTLTDAFIQLPDAEVVKRIDRLEFKVRMEDSHVMRVSFAL